jgi:hypothetical protein
VGGAIVDGQEVLVDYQFDTGGTYVLDELVNSAELRWSYQNYVSLYTRWFDSAPTLVSGTPTFVINPVTSTLYGVRADIPFRWLEEDLAVGGFAEWEDRRETISPYKRSTLNAYAQATLPLVVRGGLRIGLNQQNTEYDYTPDLDVDSRTYNLRLWARINGFDLSLDSTRTRDTGSPRVEREYTNTILRAAWRVRRLLLTLEAARTKETQLQVERTQTRGQFIVRRDF